MEEEKLTKRQRRELARQEKREEREKQANFSKIKKLLLLFIPLFLLIYVGYKSYNFLKEPTPDVLSEVIEVADTDWVKGRYQAAVILIEYGDFQCPACADYYPIVKRLSEEFPENLKVVYRHYPLIAIHNKAYDASRASEAAGRQGKFWEMHDFLYEKQVDWANAGNNKDLFIEYAKQLELDEEKFKSDFDSKEIEDKINNDLASGNSLGVNATPTFFLNGSKVQPRGYEEFKKLVEDQIKGYTLE
ncbi:MAG: Protein-disulfide isomerase [Candidatus Woesebacteria bacterium GW2011_GWB1_39_10b]|uniref:Protein-disulfide isomerase n=2 Tax=Candidatus Woeseibacteriota TaxID=1752722 RepID=A0A0G0QU60_9BACT|nr:MAG: Protein-disulfide isomerase [Microgenomates group bacterium GW2011_GWC1_38_12]KKQ94483.1 MAG: Protein-disulfide isomerase [Candidatus Woesebacteria bacterium GW2011_GWB1_39_10b]KKR13880.1 MAG: Protein-disulfide isomerase [Candidatus Woesebacteria bacterium GW2011_GWA1_39_21b]